MEKGGVEGGERERERERERKKERDNDWDFFFLEPPQSWNRRCAGVPVVRGHVPSYGGELRN